MKSVLKQGACVMKKPKVLLVDDMEVNRQVAHCLLDSLGAEVMMAENGQEALDLVKCTDFDLVFMDCAMPVMDGYEATVQIRHLEQTGKRTVPIVALTAHTDEDNRTKCKEAGMDDFIGKPVDGEKLQGMIARWLKPDE